MRWRSLRLDQNLYTKRKALDDFHSFPCYKTWETAVRLYIMKPNNYKTNIEYLPEFGARIALEFVFIDGFTFLVDWS